MSDKRIVVIGSSNTDMTIKGDKLPAPGETVAGGIFYMGPGGKGANQAVAASRLGGNTTLVCKVGRDLSETTPSKATNGRESTPPAYSAATKRLERP